MTNKLLRSPFFSYVFCIIAYSSAVGLNSHFIKKFLLQNSFSFTEIDAIEFYKLFGYIISTFLLLLSNKVLASKKIFIISLAIHIISISGIFYLPSYSLIKFCNLTLAASYITFSIKLLSKLLIETKFPKEYSLSLFFTSWALGYSGAEISIARLVLNEEFINTSKLIIINIIPVIVILLNIIFSKQFHIKLQANQPNFSLIIRNMDLEIISCFMIFYISMIIIDGYEIYALTENLLILSVTKAKYYMVGAMLIGIALTTKIRPTVNLYKVIMSSIGILIIIFSSMPIWGIYHFISAVLWVVIGLLLYIIFTSNILILTEKFEKIDLYYSILAYFLAGTIGFYAGYITMEASEDTLGENSFLISICFVLIALMVYYMLRFKMDNLSKWTKK